MHCTQCGAQGSGRFCASCGASLRALGCRGCGARLPAGLRFCTACGVPVGGARPAAARGGGGGGGAARRARPDLGWWVAGLLLLAVVVTAGISFLRSPGDSSPPAALGGAPPGAGAPPDLSAMTPREAADRLFNRVMSAAAREDTDEANAFLPMAIAAYERAAPLDDDGLFHLALLHRAAAEYGASLAAAESGLAGNPDHLLNLSAAAEASLELGRVEEGRSYYRRMLDAWDREVAAGRAEYEEHSPLLRLIREDAEALLGGGGAP